MAGHSSDMHSVHSTQPKQHPLATIVSTTTVLGYINVMFKHLPFTMAETATKKVDGAPPKEENYHCPKHPDQDLEWSACTGNSNYNRKSMEQPCELICTYIFDPHVVIIKHSGHHNHPRPSAKNHHLQH